MELEKLDEISKLLTEYKNILVTGMKTNKQGQIGYLYFEQNDQIYMLKVIKLCNQQIDMNRYNNELKEAEEIVFQLESCNHPNILQCIDKFRINEYFFIQFDRCCLNILEYLQSNEVSKSYSKEDFLQLSIEIIQGYLYLLEQSDYQVYVQPQNIFLNTNKVIQLQPFISENHEFDKMVEDAFKASRGFNDILPILKQLDVQDMLKQELLIQEKSIFNIGVILYLLTGASLDHVLDYITSKQAYTIQRFEDFQINSIIINALECQPLLTKPSLNQILFDLIAKYNTLNINKGYSDVLNKYKILEKQNVDLKKLVLDSNKRVYKHKKQLVLQMDLINEDDQQIQRKEDLTKSSNLIKLFTEGIQELYSGVFNVDYFTNLLKIEKDCYLVYQKLGYIYLHLDDNLESINYLNKTLQYNINNDNAYVCKSLNFYLIGEDQEALQNALEAISKNINNQLAIQMIYLIFKQQERPGNSLSYIYYFLGKRFQKEKQYFQALNFFHKFIQLNDKDYQPYVQMGVIYFEICEYEECLKHLNLAYEKNNQSFTANLYLGKVNFAIEQFLIADLHLQEAIQINPFKEEVYLVMGRTQMKLNNSQEAVRYLKIGLRINPNNFEINELLGQTLVGINQIEQSVQYFLKANELNPQNSADSLLQLWYLQEKLPLHLNMPLSFFIERSKMLSATNDPQIFCLLGIISYQKREFKRSLICFKKYFKCIHSNELELYCKASNWFHISNFEKAIKYFKSALKNNHQDAHLYFYEYFISKKSI